MASSWDRLGQAASVMQVTGVDAFGLVSMIVQAAHTACRNRDLCQQLARHVQVVGDLLRNLDDIPELRRRLETRRPLEQLDAALFRAYKLIRFCSQHQGNTSRIYQMFTGADVASKLGQAQEEIDRYINLIPMIALVTVVGTQDNVVNDTVPIQRPGLSLQEVMGSLALEEVPPRATLTLEAPRRVTPAIELPRGPRIFSYNELSRATHGFSDKVKLGKGGRAFYRGFLRDQELHVAIKRVTISSDQGGRVKIAELSVLSHLSHRNLVQLIGWCHEADELLLVYELLETGCLQSHLYSLKTVLTWPVRYKIILGIGDALLYLHEQHVVHGDIRPSNVMLDSYFNAKLGDFGHASIIDTSLPILAALGSLPYRDPEHMFTNMASTGADVYSFGVVLLEIASGRPPFLHGEHDSRVRLLPWVWGLYARDALLDAANPRLNGEFDAREMERALTVGLWCVHPDYSFRPSVKQAMDVMHRSEAPLPELPLERQRPPWAP